MGAVSDEDPASLAVDESSIACPAARSSSTPGEAQGKKSRRRWKQLRRQVRKRAAKATGKRHWFARRQDRAAAAAAAAAVLSRHQPLLRSVLDLDLGLLIYYSHI